MCRSDPDASSTTGSPDELNYFVVPDFIANAGGVICGAVEYRGGTETDAFDEIRQKIRSNTGEMLTRAREEQVQPRTAAVGIARQRVLTAIELRA